MRRDTVSIKGKEIKVNKKNAEKIYHTKFEEILDSEFNKVVLAVDGLLSTIGKYTSERYENGEQSLFYKVKGYDVVVNIYEPDGYEEEEE